jgi:hypothetical protein
MDGDDRTADIGVLGSDAEDPGPGRDTRRTDSKPAAATAADDPETATAMSDDDPDRTRLGTHEPGPARHWHRPGFTRGGRRA